MWYYCIEGVLNMRKLFLLIILCLLFVGCEKEESKNEKNEVIANNSQIKRYCCTDNGGKLLGDDECELDNEYNEYYNECISDANTISKNCCIDFNGHWNSYSGECTLNEPGDVDSFKNCLEDRYMDEIILEY